MSKRWNDVTAWTMKMNKTNVWMKVTSENLILAYLVIAWALVYYIWTWNVAQNVPQ